MNVCICYPPYSALRVLLQAEIVTCHISFVVSVHTNDARALFPEILPAILLYQKQEAAQSC